MVPENIILGIGRIIRPALHNEAHIAADIIIPGQSLHNSLLAAFRYSGGELLDSSRVFDS